MGFRIAEFWGEEVSKFLSRFLNASNTQDNILVNFFIVNPEIII
jgi:cytoplasmic iron level regulating protein YaaA (DUF328/UPF0246 family)